MYYDTDEIPDFLQKEFDAIERQMARAQAQRNSVPTERDMVWKTKDGRSVKVRDMLDGHLLNTHRMLVRSSRDQYEPSKWIAVLAREIASRKLTPLDPDAPVPSPPPRKTKAEKASERETQITSVGKRRLLLD